MACDANYLIIIAIFSLIIRYRVIAITGSDIDDINLNDFYRLATEDDRIFVDKSLLIEAFVKCSVKINSVVRPKGWGKTTNLDMIRRFVELQTDERGNPLSLPDLARSVNFKLFAGGRIERDNNKTIELRRLQIADVTSSNNTINIYSNSRFHNNSNNISSLMDEHYGRYPTIAISLSSITGYNYEEIETLMKRLVTNLFRRYRYLETSITDKFERTDFVTYCEGKFDKPFLLNSLKFLAKILHDRYRRRVIVLIDDYDYPIIGLFRNLLEKRLRNDDNGQRLRRPEETRQQLEREAVYREIAESEEFFSVFHFFLCFYENSFLKADVKLSKVLLTGRFDVRFANEFGGLRNVSVYTLLDNGLFDYYGFSDKEIRPLMSSGDDNILRNRCGYRYGERLLYHPSSVRHFLTRPNRNNSISTDEDDSLLYLLTDNDRTQRLIQDLIEGTTVYETVYRTFAFENISEWLFSYLVFGGYLQSDKFGFEQRHRLSIPNERVRNVLKSTVTIWTREQFNLSSDDLTYAARCLSNFKVPGFKAKLKPLSAGPSSMNLSEICYDGLIKSLTYALESNYTVYTNDRRDNKPNVTLVEKRPDKKRPDKVIFIDYKFEPDPRRAEKEVEIRLRNYDEKLTDTILNEYDRVKRVLKIIIVFTGKSVRLLYQKDSYDRQLTTITVSFGFPRINASTTPRPVRRRTPSNLIYDPKDGYFYDRY